MKKNFGYRLGTLVRRFKEWNHPILLKWFYVILCVFIIYKLHLVLYIAVGSILGLIAIVLIANFIHENSPIIQRQKIIEELQNIKKSQNKTIYNDKIIGSGNGTGNGC
ncbi:TPA: hypothetical protein RNX16_002151 [Pasteurella multocida]|nr:hypothetical protein [Pasteurella multocida]HDX1142274.1 hypothetical protein [Pasteurella multocida]